MKSERSCSSDHLTDNHICLNRPRFLIMEETITDIEPWNDDRAMSGTAACLGVDKKIQKNDVGP
jgi:hypothetical protein